MVEATSSLARLLRRKRAMEFAEIQSASGGRSRRSLFRDLISLGHLTSFTHAGRYYTLADIPQFDEHGLWFFQGVGFSRSGTLKKTLLETVGAAVDGYTHRELEALLHIRVYNTLLDLVREQLIGRERIDKLYLYVSAEEERAAAQVIVRRERMSVETEARALPDDVVIDVLLEVVNAGKVLVTPATVAERLRVRGVSVSKAQAEQVYARYGIEVKKTAHPR